MDNKEKYGEVITPLPIIEEMYENCSDYIIKDLEEKTRFNTINILDVGSGDGKFIKCFIEKFPKISKKCIFYGIEINNDYQTIFYDNMKKIKNIEDYKIFFVNDSILLDKNLITSKKFDFIIGNIPFNNNGFIKVPCNTKISKKQEGQSIWYDCIQKSLKLLNDKGFILMITPCLWLKPDKSNTYEKLVNDNDLLLVKNYDSLESHKIFKYKAQTPINYFLSIKKTNNVKQKSKKICIINQNKKQIFELKYNYPIPTHYLDDVLKGQEIMKKHKVGNMIKNILKSNPVNEKNKGVTNNYHETKFKNIKTCKINKKTYDFEVIYDYSSEECPFYKKSKIFCSHKRLPYFFEDLDGNYGISKRDTFIITENVLMEVYSSKINKNNSRYYLSLLCKYLNHNFIQNILKSTKYRMNFLEKYAYFYVPNIIEYVIKKNITDKNYDDIIENFLLP